MIAINDSNRASRLDNPRIKKQKVQQIKMHSECSECGYDKNTVALQFHHIDDKNGTITSLAESGCSWEELLRELKKCKILCANCHAIVHSNDQ